MRYLLLDCDFLCHRAFHVTGKLTYKGRPTGVLFGFFRTLVALHEQFHPCRFVFCFDRGEPQRREVFPEYKASRHFAHRSRDENIHRKNRLRQTKELRRDWLPLLGFRNVYSQDGYEADDIIASLVQRYHIERDLVIVSSDSDLYQLLRLRVSMYDPNSKRTLTNSKFHKRFGIQPDLWVKVKAMAGCSTDGIPGLRGIGVATACKMLRGDLVDRLARVVADEDKSRIIARNEGLVRLPFPGTKRYHIVKDSGPSLIEWNHMCKQLGFRSLMGDCPTDIGCDA